MRGERAGDASGVMRRLGRLFAATPAAAGAAPGLLAVYMAAVEALADIARGRIAVGSDTPLAAEVTGLVVVRVAFAGAIFPILAGRVGFVVGLAVGFAVVTAEWGLFAVVLRFSSVRSENDDRVGGGRAGLARDEELGSGVPAWPLNAADAAACAELMEKKKK